MAPVNIKGKNSQLKIASTFVAVFYFLIACNNKSTIFDGWTKAHGNSHGNKYSSLTQIDTSNVQQLEVVWEYHTGDADTSADSQIQCNPIIIDGVMYGTSPMLKLFAIDAATGRQKWIFSPYDTITEDKVSHFI